jgi:hypothetical protein
MMLLMMRPGTAVIFRLTKLVLIIVSQARAYPEYRHIQLPMIVPAM